MCGIAGQLKLESGGRADADRVSAMLAQLIHRGPDEEGLISRGPLAMGTRRLKIIDLAGGQQPIANEDGTIWVSFNGEIFNHDALRRELIAQGHTFRSRCDTEVLVHLYEEHGDDFCHRLNGQFAFALWDEKRRRLLLTRDRMGIRPLFHARVGDTLMWASEIKALLAAGVPAKLDPVGLQHVFTFGAPSAPVTMFAGIRQLPAGHQLMIEDGNIKERTWWDLEMPQAGEVVDRGLETHATEVRDLLDDAVRLQLGADVPVGVYLSGGLDSSIVAALTKKHGLSPLRTFSIGFDSSFFDESNHAKQVATFLGAEHHALQCRTAELAGGLPAAVYHTEHPSLVTEMVPLMLLSRLARRDVTVVLSGEGADEAFGGYHYFRVEKLRRMLSEGPLSLFAPLARWGLRRKFGADFVLPSSEVAADVAKRFGFYPAMQFEFEMGARLFAAVAAPDLLEKLAGHDPVEDLALPRAKLAGWSPFDQATYLSYRLRLANHQVSPLGDRVTMASSVEGRYPFLDHRLVEMSARVPQVHKLKGFREKHVLREAFAPILPPDVTKRSKQPFQAPLGSTLIQSSEPYVAEMLSEKSIADRGYFDPRAVQAMIERLRDYERRSPNTIDHDRVQAELAIVGVLTTHLFDEIFLRRRAFDTLAQFDGTSARVGHS